MRCLVLALSTVLLAAAAAGQQARSEPDAAKRAKVTPLSPERALQGFELPAGYHLELVASEPMIHEPAALAWDGNGRMYCAEMRTYMQDIDGSDELQPNSRISRLEDTDGDGRVDRCTVFADGLVLPRMILPLRDSILVRETGTLDLWELRDTDGDGRADQRVKVYDGGARGGNLEHQPSGLDWDLDNYLYVTYTAKRYRYRNGSVQAFPLAAGDGQWGLTHDDEGNLFYSRAGGEVPAASFQQNLLYGKLELPGQMDDDFAAVWPIDEIPDVQGGPGRLRPDNTLNHFTACCGQVIYRGDRLPADLRGDLLIAEPVGRLIRRARVTMEHGVRRLSNATPGSEFLRTKDPNFRPVNLYTAPDGTLYIVDMYRGIIQEGNWVREGSYLRGVVQQYGLDHNIGRGRIYRLVHDGFERGPRPHMLDESSAALVHHLSHHNGWWRDTAQKLLVLRGDHSVVPALSELLANGADPLGRLHALWTLDGLDAIGTGQVLAAWHDRDPRVRRAAVRVAERFLRPQPDAELLAGLRRLARDPDVAAQVARTAILCQLPDLEPLLDGIVAAHPDDRGIAGTVRAYRERVARQKAEAERLARIARENRELAAAVERGKVVFHTLCFTCHGPDGRGAPIPGQTAFHLAPPLVGSPRVLGSEQRLVRILLHGMVGPVDGVTYPGAMASMAANGDAWIADGLTYVRNSWGNRAPRITAAQVAALRAATRDRTAPWTEPELRHFDPTLRNRSLWKLTASCGAAQLARAVDGNAGSRWTTGRHQESGMWLRIELPCAARIEALDLDTQRSPHDYPRGYEIRVSDDGRSWGEPIANGAGQEGRSLLPIEPVTARHLEIPQTGQSGDYYWSIHELQLYGEDNPIPAPPGGQR